MTRRAEGWAIAGAVLLTGVGAVAVYRAANQSVVYDEAFSYLAFLSGSPTLVFTEYTANNHVLFSVLARVSVAVFGVSQFALRLPTVMFAAVFLGVTFLLIRRVCGGGYLLLAAAAAIALNPFVLDFLSAARGYGMALALFMLGLFQLLEASLSAPGALGRKWAAASVALGLSACANLTFAVPASCLLMIAVGVDVRRGGPDQHQSAAGYLRLVGRSALLPGIVAALVILAAPLSTAHVGHFFYGTPSFQQTSLSLIAASFAHGRSAWPADPEAVDPVAFLLACQWLVVMPSLMLVVGWSAAWVRRGLTSHAADASAMFCLLTAGTLAASISMLVAGHLIAGVPYPYGRTGLYLAVLLSAAVIGLAATLRRSSSRAGRRLAAVLAGLLVIAGLRFASEFTTTHFYHWRFDAGTSDIVARIESARAAADHDLHIAVAEVFVPSVEFYRVVRNIKGVEFVSGPWFEHPAEFDFFIVSPTSAVELNADAAAVFVHPISGAVLMKSRTR